MTRIEDVPEEMKIDIAERLSKGESLRSIARSYGILYQQIQYWRRRWGLPILRPAQVKGSDHPRWKGGRSVDARWGYVRVFAPERPCSSLYTYEHVLIAEKKIGRFLRKNEHVHHLDGNKLNNDPENLLVCTASQHRHLHHQLEELALNLVTKGKIIYHDGTYTWA